MQAFTTLTQSQRNIFSFTWKRTITLYWNLLTSELLLFVLFFFFIFYFFYLLLCSPLPNFWGKACWGERLNHPILIIVFFYYYFNLKVKKNFMRWLSLDGVPKGVLTDNIPILLHNTSTHWPILPYNRYLCQIQYVSKF